MELTSNNPHMLKVIEIVNQVAPSDSTVLITGGKRNRQEPYSKGITFSKFKIE